MLNNKILISSNTKRLYCLTTITNEMHYESAKVIWESPTGTQSKDLSPLESFQANIKIGTYIRHYMIDSPEGETWISDSSSNWSGDRLIRWAANSYVILGILT